MRRIYIRFGAQSTDYLEEGVMETDGKCTVEYWPYTFGRVFDTTTQEFLGIAEEGKLLPPAESQQVSEQYFS